MLQHMSSLNRHAHVTFCQSLTRGIRVQGQTSHPAPAQSLQPLTSMPLLQFSMLPPVSNVKSRAPQYVLPTSVNETATS